MSVTQLQAFSTLSNHLHPRKPNQDNGLSPKEMMNAKSVLNKLATPHHNTIDICIYVT